MPMKMWVKQLLLVSNDGDMCFNTLCITLMTCKREMLIEGGLGVDGLRTLGEFDHMEDTGRIEVSK